MSKEFYLITDATAEEVECKTGLRGRDTHLGALVEKPEPFCLDAALERFERAMRGPPCCSGAVIHQPWCKNWGVVT